MRRPEPIRIGFVPLADCATLVVASELGYFDKYNVKVDLVREPGWASIRDKIIYGELTMAHAVAGLPFAITYGLGSLRHACETGFVFNANGDGITLSNELIEKGITDANQLAVELKTSRRERSFTLGIPHPFSSHHFILNQWLKPAGILPGRDVQLQVLPPSLMPMCLKQGHIDGFCVGEPYNTVAERGGWGTMITSSSEISPAHPEKTLLTTREFSETQHDDHLSIIAALAEASDFCETPKGRKEAVKLLGREDYIELESDILEASLVAKKGQPSDFHRFGGEQINRPDAEKASWIMSHMRAAGLMDEIGNGPLTPPIDQIFRTDLYDAALEKTHLSTTAN